MKSIQIFILLCLFFIIFSEASATTHCAILSVIKEHHSLDVEYLPEVNGLAVSKRHADVFYHINDSKAKGERIVTRGKTPG